MCHHPPISYLLEVGPNDIYRFSSWCSLSPKAHLNSIDLCVKGQKKLTFNDGSSITWNPNADTFSNTLFGTLTHQINGKIEFSDDTTGVTAFYEIGNCGKKGLPKDYFKGEIRQHGRVVSSIYGTYGGYCDFDGKRYFDIRQMQNFIAQPVPPTEKSNPNRPESLPIVLPSDCTNRADSVTLISGDVEAAQLRKNEIEDVQRHDKKLRDAAKKRREKGGKKIDYSVYKKDA